MEKQSVQDNPWFNLGTITKFDRGNYSKTPIRLDNRTETQGNSKLVPSATLQFLIETIIKQMCTMRERDSVKRDKLYFTICDRLNEIGIIDTSYNSKEVENIRKQFEHTLYQLVMVAHAANECKIPLNAPSFLMAEWSRYHVEFKEKEFIAAGGFSNVFKALHILDGIEYAVKKIVVKPGQVSTIKQHLEEVKVLAKLNHPNIVAYKTAWIEPMLITAIVPSLPNIEGEGNKNQFSKYQTKRLHEINNLNYNSLSISDSNSSNKYNGNDTSLKSNKTGRKIIELSSEDSSDIVSFRSNSEDRISNTDHSESNTDHSESNTDHSKSKTEITDSIDPSSNSNSNKKITQHDSQQMSHCFATLYIQMALCEKTLHQWLRERDDPPSQMTITSIFTQILQGVNHIHSTGMVHHDIKPSNIFITEHFQIQLGDFGLACPLQRKNHDTIIGTRLYAAPEQLKGKCNAKSDIYSLGIVLLELLIHAKTQMELCHTIEEFKKGRVPTSLTANYPQWTQIIYQLIQEDPDKRPSTDKLLLNLRDDKDTIISQLKDDIVEKDTTIKQLEERIAKLEANIIKPEIP